MKKNVLELNTQAIPKESDRLQYPTVDCNTLQHAATRCSTLQHTTTRGMRYPIIDCDGVSKYFAGYPVH